MVSNYPWYPTIHGSNYPSIYDIQLSMVSKYPHIRKKLYPLIPKNNAQKNLISELVTELAQLKFIFSIVVKLQNRVVWLTFCPEQWSMNKVMISSHTVQQTVVRNHDHAQARSSCHAQWGIFFLSYMTWHCKCLQGFTGTLRGNRSAGISNLRGLHVYPQSL